MKIFRILLLFSLIFAVFAGCSKSDEDEIKETLTDFIDAYKSKDFYALNDYFENGGCIIQDLYIPESNENGLIIDTITENLSYSINNITINDNTAEAELTSSNADMLNIMPVIVGTFLEKGSEKFQDPDFNADELLYEILKENLLDDNHLKENIAKKELTFTVPLVKVDGTWLISDDDVTTQFYDGLTGQYFSYVLDTTQTYSAISDFTDN